MDLSVSPTQYQSMQANRIALVFYLDALISGNFNLVNLTSNHLVLCVFNVFLCSVEEHSTTSGTKCSYVNNLQY